MFRLPLTCVTLKWPKMAPSWPKMAPRWPQDGSKMAPRWPEDGPKKPQNGAHARAPCTFCQIGLTSSFPLRVSSVISARHLETAQDGPKIAQDGPKTAANGQTRPQNGPTRAQSGIKRTRDGPKMDPKKMQTHTKKLHFPLFGHIIIRIQTQKPPT